MAVSKRKCYEDLYDQITAAIEGEFFLEAASLEYAIMEDRTTQALAWARESVVDKNGRRIARPRLELKINTLKAQLVSNPELMRAMRGPSILDAAHAWRRRRNSIAHALAGCVKPWSALKGDARSSPKMASPWFEIFPALECASAREDDAVVTRSSSREQPSHILGLFERRPPKSACPATWR